MSNDDINGTLDASTYDTANTIVLPAGTVLKWKHNLAALSGTIDIFFQRLEADHADLFELWTTNAYSFRGKTYCARRARRRRRRW